MPVPTERKTIVNWNTVSQKKMMKKKAVRLGYGANFSEFIRDAAEEKTSPKAE